MKKVIFLLLSAVFLFFAALQYNDPDAVLWSLVYFVYVVFCLSVVFRPLNSIWYIVGFVAPLIAAVFQWPNHWEGFGDTMLNENTERARESSGLIICGLSSLLCKALKS